MRIFLVILGLLFLGAGAACAVPSFVTYRAIDGDGYVNGDGRMTTVTAALVTRTAQFEEVTQEEVEEGRTGGDVRLRIAAERVDGGDVTVAIGNAEAVQSLVVRGSSESVNDLEFDPFRYRGVAVGGVRPLNAPEEGLFAAYASGPGRQEITWTVEAGEWRALIMNADGSAGVDVEVRFGARFPYLRGFAIAGMVIGGFLGAIGLVILLFQVRRRRKPAPSSPPDEPEPQPTT